MDKGSIWNATKTCTAVFVVAFAVMYLGILSYMAYAQEMEWPTSTIGIGVTIIITTVLALAIVVTHLLEQ